MPKVKTKGGKVVHLPYTTEGKAKAEEMTAKQRKKMNRMEKGGKKK